MTGDYYTLKGKLKYLNGTFLILAIFALDCLTGSVTALMGQAETTDEWLKQIMVFINAVTLPVKQSNAKIARIKQVPLRYFNLPFNV